MKEAKISLLKTGGPELLMCHRLIAIDHVHNIWY